MGLLYRLRAVALGPKRSDSARSGQCSAGTLWTKSFNGVSGCRSFEIEQLLSAGGDAAEMKFMECCRYLRQADGAGIDRAVRRGGFQPLAGEVALRPVPADADDRVPGTGCRANTYNKVRAPTGTMVLRPGPLRLSIDNRTDVRVLPSVWIAGDPLHDLLGKRKPFLTAKRLLTNQTFRDIYRTDTLDVDQELKITSLTFLFTDLKGSTSARRAGRRPCGVRPGARALSSPA